MTTSVYPIHRAMNRPIQFKGLQGQYIMIAAAGLIGDLFLFVVLYFCRVPAWCCAIIVLAVGAGILSACMSVSRKYGIHGIRKWRARRRVPASIRCRSRRSFTA